MKFKRGAESHASFFFSRILLSEHIRYAHVTAKAPVLAAVTENTDIHFPRVRLGGFHMHSYLTTDAAALDAGRTDRQTVNRSFRLSAKLVLICQTAIPAPIRSRLLVTLSNV